MATFQDKSDEELDAEFIKILRLMKPYITCIMNNHYIELVRLWLERLSDVNFANKVQRNKYLVELGKQIEVGVFEEPFTEPPPKGDLPVFSIYMARSEEIMDNSEFVKYDSVPKIGYAQENEENYKSKRHIPVPKLQLPQSDSNSTLGNLLTGDDICNFKQQCSLKRQQLDKARKQRGFKPVDISHSQKILCTEEPTAYPNFASRQPYSSPHIQREAPKRHKFETDSSWYDLTETTQDTIMGTTNTKRYSNYHGGDMHPKSTSREYYEHRISKLLCIIDELKQENLALQQSMDKCKKDLNLRNTKAETSIHKLTGEVSALKKRLQELVDIKFTLQNNHYAMSNEWKTNLGTLQTKLQDTLKKNLELRSLIIILEKKLRELVKLKNNKTKTIKKKLSSIHHKEMDSLKEMHMTALKEMKETLTEQFQNQMTTIKAEYEKEIQSKNDEIERMEVLLREQCERMQTEVRIIKSEVARENISIQENNMQEQKIEYLQKCIMKLEKLFNKSEKEYMKQISKLKYEAELKEKTNKLALSKQKAEILSNASTSYQLDIDSIVSTLEEHYQELLRKHQEQSVEDKRRDSETINQLRQEITQLKKL